MSIRNKQIQCNDLTFDCIEAGESDKVLVILLHGFPESSMMWVKLMIELASKGFYVLAPNMRGYSPGARPKGKEHYLLENLSDDIIQIANALGSQKFHLIGHDWGAAVGWKVAADYHEKVLSLTAISVPHPRAMAKAIKSDPEQRKMSRYIFQILLPFLPEWYLLRKNNRMLRKIWKYCSDQEITEYLKIHGTREGLTATLNYYRANFGRNTRDKRGKVGNVNVKTCYIWGENDHALGSTGAESCGQYVDGAYSFIKLNGGHWLMQRNYEEVKNEILLQLK